MTAVTNKRSRTESPVVDQPEPKLSAKAKENYELFRKGVGETLFKGVKLDDKKIIELMDRCPHEISELFRKCANLPKAKLATVWKLADGKLAQKIHHAKEALTAKTTSLYHAESARAFATYLTEFIVHCVDTAPTLAPELRPEWMGFLLSQNGQECVYSPIGEKVCQFTKSHKKLILDVLELNFLNTTLLLVERLAVLQDKNPFMHLDVICELNKKAADHFSACKDSKGIAEKKRKAEEFFLESLSLSLEKTFFPHGGKGLELPFSETVRESLDDYLLNVLKKQLMPHLSQTLYDLVCSDYMKTSMLFEMMNFVHRAVDIEAPMEVSKEEKIRYPRFSELTASVEKSMRSILSYFDPDFLTWLESKVSLATIAEKFAKQLVVKYQDITLLDLQKKAIHRALPQLVPGSVWKEMPTHDACFIMGKCSFDYTAETREKEQKVKDKEVADKQRELGEITAKIGKDCKGLHAMIESFAFGPSKPSTSLLDSIGRGFKHIVASAASSFTGAPEKIQRLCKQIVLKIRQPEHEPMLYEVARVFLTLPGLGAEL